jgi:hypothetical protein
MNQAHARAVVEAVIPELKAYTDKKSEMLAARIDELKAIISDLTTRSPEKGEPGKDGTSVKVDDVAPLITEAVQKAVAELPPAKDGANGSSVTLEDVAPLVQDAVEKAVAAIPPAKDGADGTKGADGASVTVDDVAPLIAEQVQKAVAALPVPKDGEPGPAGQDGAPGTSVTVEDVAPLIAEHIEKAVAAIPRPKDGEKGDRGADGRDASDLPMLQKFIAAEVQSSVLSTFKTMSLGTPDDGRTLVFGFDVGGQPVSHEIKTALMLDRGVWRAGPFAKGDGVTWRGSFFIAQDDTTEADQPEVSKTWRLAVKRGRDGTDGKNGEKGQPGIQGPRGEQGPRGFGV